MLRMNQLSVISHVRLTQISMAVRDGGGGVIKDILIYEVRAILLGTILRGIDNHISDIHRRP